VKRLLTWDWKEQPDPAELARILSELTDGMVHLIEVDTEDDQYAWVLSTEPTSAAEATALYLQPCDES
jgi:hypothetical protein